MTDSIQQYIEGVQDYLATKPEGNSYGVHSHRIGSSCIECPDTWPKARLFRNSLSWTLTPIGER